jgi:hypothetical protein
MVGIIIAFGDKGKFIGDKSKFFLANQSRKGGRLKAEGWPSAVAAERHAGSIAPGREVWRVRASMGDLNVETRTTTAIQGVTRRSCLPARPGG